MVKIKSLFWLVSLQIIIQISDIESKPQPGQKVAFGTGILAGGLAGAAVTSILTQNSPTAHHFHNESINPLSPVPSQIPATTVVRGEIFANGCYKQVIKEADVTDIRRFIETEQLICPAGISPSVTVLSNQLQQPIITPVQMMPLVPMVSGQSIASSLPQTNITQYYAAPPTAPEMELPNIAPVNSTHIAVLPPPSMPTAALPPFLTSQKNESSVMELPLNSTAIPVVPFMPAITYQPIESDMQPNISYRPIAPSYAPEINPPYLEPVNPAPIAVLPPPSIPSAPMPAIITQQKNEPSVINPPVLAEIPKNTSQVMIISKKVGYYDHEKKKNTANTLNSGNYLVLFVLITIFTNFV